MTYKQLIRQKQNIAGLTPKEKKICLKALAHLSALDGCVDEDEKAYIADKAHAYGIEESADLFVSCEEQDLLEDLKHLTNPSACLELIKDLCFLGHADDNLSPEEVLFIGHAGLAMGITIEKIEQISDWVVDHIIWQERGKLLMGLTENMEKAHEN